MVKHGSEAEESINTAGQQDGQATPVSDSTGLTGATCGDGFASAAASGNTIEDSAGALRIAAIQQLAEFVVTELPKLELKPRDAQAARTYLIRSAGADPSQGDNAVTVVKTATEVMKEFHSNTETAGKCSNVCSVSRLLNAAQAMYLRPQELREIAHIAVAQGRPLEKVLGFIQRLAADQRTDDARHRALRDASPEQRESLIDDGLALLRELRDYEDVWGESISLTLISALVKRSSPCEVIKMLGTLHEAPLHNTGFEYLDRAPAFHVTILTVFARWLRRDSANPFDIGAFLTERRAQWQKRHRYSEEHDVEEG
jgi:hypothetical protein